MIRLDAFVDENRTRLKMNKKFIEKKLNSIHVVRFEFTGGEVIGEDCKKSTVQDCGQKFIHRILICSLSLQLLTLDCKTKYNHPLQKNLHDVVTSKS